MEEEEEEDEEEEEGGHGTAYEEEEEEEEDEEEAHGSGIAGHARRRAYSSRGSAGAQSCGVTSVLSSMKAGELPPIEELDLEDEKSNRFTMSGTRSGNVAKKLREIKQEIEEEEKRRASEYGVNPRRISERDIEEEEFEQLECGEIDENITYNTLERDSDRFVHRQNRLTEDEEMKVPSSEEKNGEILIHTTYSSEKSDTKQKRRQKYAVTTQGRENMDSNVARNAGLIKVQRVQDELSPPRAVPGWIEEARSGRSYHSSSESSSASAPRSRSLRAS